MTMIMNSSGVSGVLEDSGERVGDLTKHARHVAQAQAEGGAKAPGYLLTSHI